jgi:hypothetical protein
MFIDLAEFLVKLSDIKHGTVKRMDAFFRVRVAEVSKEIAKQFRKIHNPDSDLLS